MDLRDEDPTIGSNDIRPSFLCRVKDGPNDVGGDIAGENALVSEEDTSGDSSLPAELGLPTAAARVA